MRQGRIRLGLFLVLVSVGWGQDRVVEREPDPVPVTPAPVKFGLRWMSHTPTSTGTLEVPRYLLFQAKPLPGGVRADLEGGRVTANGTTTVPEVQSTLELTVPPEFLRALVEVIRIKAVMDRDARLREPIRYPWQ
jgi:hypothetical protein